MQVSLLSPIKFCHQENIQMCHSLEKSHSAVLMDSSVCFKVLSHIHNLVPTDGLRCGNLQIFEIFVQIVAEHGKMFIFEKLKQFLSDVIQSSVWLALIPRSQNFKLSCHIIKNVR